MFKQISPYLRKFKKLLVGAFICLALEDSVEMVIPLVIADIIDNGVVKGDSRRVFLSGAVMLVLAFTALMLGRTYAKLIGKGGQGFAAELRRAEFERVQLYSFANADHFRASSLMTRLTGDVQIVQNMITSGIRPGTRAPVTILCTVIFSLILDARLTLIYLIALPVLSIGMFLIIKHVRPLYYKQQASVDHLNLIIRENLTAIQIVKAYCREDYEEAKFLAVNAEQRDITEKSNRITALSTPLMQFGVYAVICLMLLFGGKLCLEGKTTIGALTGILSYLRQALNSLMMMSNVLMLITRSAASVARISEVFAEKIDITDDKARDINVEHGGMEFDHVSFKYSSSAPEYVLSDINLNIRAGETIGIIGGTGSAKTSLIQLIPRLYDVTEGELRIDGQPVKDYPLVRLRDAVGVVLQKNTLFSGTIAENLRWGKANASMAELRTACRDAAADDFIMEKPEGYETKLGRGGAGLSGGQKQRVCIARALLKHPKILIFDDSTSAVDVRTEAMIRDNLREHYPSMTKIIIAQRITSIMHADRIVILEDGRINAVGTHESLLNDNTIYREIYHSQMEGAQL